MDASLIVRHSSKMGIKMDTKTKWDERQTESRGQTPIRTKIDREERGEDNFSAVVQSSIKGRSPTGLKCYSTIQVAAIPWISRLTVQKRSLNDPIAQERWFGRRQKDRNRKLWRNRFNPRSVCALFFLIFCPVTLLFNSGIWIAKDSKNIIIPEGNHGTCLRLHWRLLPN